MVHYPASEIFVYKTDHSSVLYCTAEYFYKTTMVYRIEESFKVYVDYILIAFVDYLLCSP